MNAQKSYLRKSWWLPSFDRLHREDCQKPYQTNAKSSKCDPLKRVKSSEPKQPTTLQNPQYRTKSYETLPTANKRQWIPMANPKQLDCCPNDYVLNGCRGQLPLRIGGQEDNIKCEKYLLNEFIRLDTMIRSDSLLQQGEFHDRIYFRTGLNSKPSILISRKIIEKI